MPRMKDKTQYCKICEKTKPLPEFGIRSETSFKRKVCYECVELQRRSRVSASYESFLHHLWVRTKNRVSRKDAPVNEFSITEDHLKNLWTDNDGRCALSGVHMTHHSDGGGRKDLNASVDRIDSEKGYIPGNVQLVCTRVNLMRHSLSTSDFYWWVKTIHDHSCD